MGVGGKVLPPVGRALRSVVWRYPVKAHKGHLILKGKYHPPVP